MLIGGKDVAEIEELPQKVGTLPPLNGVHVLASNNNLWSAVA
jgi:hypothetical protein